MFSNIERKLKRLAVAGTIIGTVTFISLGVAIQVVGGMLLPDYSSLLQILSSIVITFGTLFSWICSFGTYGFGELIETNKQLVMLTESIREQIADKENTDNHITMKTNNCKAAEPAGNKTSSEQS